MKLSNAFIAPNAEYPLGTDNMGRCIYSRIIEGSRISLTTASAVVIISVAIGTFIGLISGYCGGKLDAIVMRVVDVFLAFPTIVFALAVSAFLGSGPVNLIIALSFIQWTRYARMARGEVILLKNAEYIEAARAIGNNRLQVMFKYLLPNVASKILIMMSLDIGSIILYCASLSFLGLGAQPPSPDWGAMISDGKDYLRFSPWMSLFPGLAVAFSALSFNMLGDGLRDLIDPRMRESVSAE
jgi:peptide/nickel transport system permease protein